MRSISFLLAAAIAAAAPAVLAPTPAALSFTWVAGGTLPVAQTVIVKPAGSTVAFTTTVLPPGGAPWITITPSSGNLPATMSVLVNPEALAVGSYSASIQFSAMGFASVMIPVTLTVQQPLANLVLTSNSLSFTSATPPAVAATQTVTLTTTGGPVTFNAAAASTPWLAVSVAGAAAGTTTAVVLPGFPVTLNVDVNSTGLIPSAIAYTGKITIVAQNVPTANATQTISVSLLVNALVPTITNLYPSAALVGSGPLTLTVTGTGFYKGGTTATVGATPLATPTYVSPTTLLIVLPVSLLATVGPISISVVNPVPGGPSLSAAIFTVSPTPVVQAVVNAASYAGGTIAPGEFISLFGTAIGPVAPAGMSVVGGYATTTLGGVSATIDGVAAAMIYVSANQLTVQVPYTVTLGAGKVVAVMNGLVPEAFAPNVTIAAAAPGLFLDAGVTGQCAALRFSAATSTFSVNSANSAAVVGDTVVFYLTGEGIYDANLPSQISGYIVPSPSVTPLVQMSPLPTVVIGGVGASVTYAGVVPGSLIGVFQINAIVPSGATTGAAVPVTITIGGVSTQAGATIVTK